MRRGHLIEAAALRSMLDGVRAERSYNGTLILEAEQV